jgi:hypothetical protein
MYMGERQYTAVSQSERRKSTNSVGECSLKLLVVKLRMERGPRDYDVGGSVFILYKNKLGPTAYPSITYQYVVSGLAVEWVSRRDLAFNRCGS